MADINDERKWNSFLKKLTTKTSDGEIEWYESPSARRQNPLGPIFTAEILPGKFAAIYRYWYNYYTDVDEYTRQEGVSVEFVDEDGEKLWQLPSVAARFALIDLIEYNEADADDILKQFLSGEE